MDGQQAVTGQGAGRPRFSRTLRAFAAGSVFLMLGLAWWQRRADDFGSAVLAVEDALGLNARPQPASGTVLVNGRPLPRGEISFFASPNTPGQTGRVGGRTQIRDGRYAFLPGTGPITTEVYEVTIERWSPALERLKGMAARGQRPDPADWAAHVVKTKVKLKLDGKVDFDLNVPGW